MEDLLQSEGWEQFQRALGRKVQRVDGVLGITMPLPFGGTYCYSPRAPLSRHLERSEAESRDLRSAVFLRSEFDPKLSTLNSHLSTPRVLRHAIEPAWTWRTSLAASDDERLAAMHEKHRYNIRLAAKRGVVVRAVPFSSSSRAERSGAERSPGDRQGISPLRSSPTHSGRNDEFEKDFAACWTLLQNTAERKEIGTHARAYYETMLRELPQTTPWIAERAGEAIACAIVAYHGDTATYLHGGSAHAHRALMAPHLLHWMAMRAAKEAGMQWYDFGGIEPPKTEERRTQNGEHSEGASTSFPSSSSSVLRSGWAGITRFKQGFGGEAVQHPPMRDLIFRPTRYRMLSWLARLRG